MYTYAVEKHEYVWFEYKGVLRMATESKQPISIYLSYAQKDEALKQEFEDYLVIMQQNGLISGWVERRIQPGTDWSQIIDPRLLAADLVLLLVSPSLLASGYCSGAEAREAFDRSKNDKTGIIPIMLHHVNMARYPLERIVSAPMNGRPVSSWSDRSEAWKQIERDIRASIEYFTR
jgi:TIR domain